MQVSQQDDFITHAVIGNQESVEMGVSDDAALMHILSSTLYTHPKLAVVREIICNGWDAHIAAGKTDTPLQITISGSQLTVRDFGFGIAHDEIGPIYGVYGNSTKRGDSKSTGGFGLGSKAPFAYTDNFEVVSHHLGQKTVYRVSKSSMEKGGKPSINKIVALSTDETGIAVSFGIRVQDHQEFLKLIREVLVLGEIQASINGEEPIATFPLLASPTGYVVTDFRGTVGGEINVRYGNVVYPIPMRNEYQDQYTRITKDMENLWDRTTITFMAPPDSISIAPNREAIILTDGTIATIKALLDTYDYKAVVGCLKAAREQCLAQLNKKVRALDDDALLKNFAQRNSLDCIPPSCQTLVGKFANHIKQAALHVHANRIGANMSGHLVQKRMLEELIRRGLLNKPLAKAWLKAKGCESRFYTYRRLAQSLVARHLQYPLQQAMGELGDLTGIRHRIYINNGSYHYGYFCKDYLEALRERQDMNLLLAKHALIARDQKEAAEYFTNNQHTRMRSYLVVYVGANKKSDERKASVHALLTKLQYPIEEHFPARVQKVRVPVTDKLQVRSKKKTGYMSLAHSHDKRRKSFLLSHAREHFTEDTLIEKPIAWTILNSRGDRDGKFERLNEETCQLILQLFGDKIAVVTAVQATKLKEQGIQNVTDFIVKYADEKLAATPDIKRFAAFAQHVGDRWDGGHKILFNMCFHEDLMKSLGLRFHISPDSAVLMKVCRNIDSSMSMFEKCKEAMKHVKPHPMVETCKEKLRSSPWADYIDFDHLNRNLTAATPGSEECEIPYTIVQHLLK